MKCGDSSALSNLNKLSYKFWRNARRCLAAVQLLKLGDVFMAVIPQRTVYVLGRPDTKFCHGPTW